MKKWFYKMKMRMYINGAISVGDFHNAIKAMKVIGDV